MPANRYEITAGGKCRLLSRYCHSATSVSILLKTGLPEVPVRVSFVIDSIIENRNYLGTMAVDSTHPEPVEVGRGTGQVSLLSMSVL